MVFAFLTSLYELQVIVVTPVVHVPVTALKFYMQVFQKDSSESLHIWTIGTLEGWFLSMISDPQGPCHGMGLEVQI